MIAGVDVVIVYHGNTVSHVGKARTERAVLVKAYGGGDTPFGKAHDGVVLWRAELRGTCSELEDLGATWNEATNTWTYTTSRGHKIPCVELLCRVVSTRAR